MSRGTDASNSKVTAILSTSYSDVEFREALFLFDKRGARNDATTRRHIRLDIHKELIDCNGDILGEFGRVAEVGRSIHYEIKIKNDVTDDQQLRCIKATVQKLNSGFEAMKAQVAVGHTLTHPVLVEASSLLEKRKQIEARQEVVDAFNYHFIMSSDEIIALTSMMEPVNEWFFDTLFKAKRICQDCNLLLGFEQQTLGLELLDQASKNLDLGFQKLYKWVQREFKMLNLENPQINSSIRQALRLLAEKPSLFQNCLNVFAEAREHSLSELFRCALTETTTQGMKNSTIKPINFATHDPLRYLGDMLAWVHSAMVSEREALEVLYFAEGEQLANGLRSSQDVEMWQLIADDSDKEVGFNALKELNQLVDRSIPGVARVLRQQIEQVIQSNDDITLAYEVATIIDFYRITFQKLLGAESYFLDVVENLETEAMRQFRSLIRDNITAAQGEFQQIPPNLESPNFLQVLFKQFDPIIRTHESSLLASEDRKCEFQDVLAEGFEPFLVGCEKMARSIEPPNDATFRINCRFAAAMFLGNFDSTRNRASQLQEQIKTDAARLVKSQYAFFCEGSGLKTLFDCLKDGKLVDVSQDLLSQASQVLDDFLPSALIEAMDRLNGLQDSALAQSITEKAVELFCSNFEELERSLWAMDRDLEESNSLQGLRSIFPRTTTDIRVLLS